MPFACPVRTERGEGGLVRTGVSDTRGDREPMPSFTEPGEGGCGLLLVSALTSAWAPKTTASKDRPGDGADVPTSRQSGVIG